MRAENRKPYAKPRGTPMEPGDLGPFAEGLFTAEELDELTQIFRDRVSHLLSPVRLPVPLTILDLSLDT